MNKVWYFFIFVVSLFMAACESDMLEEQFVVKKDQIFSSVKWQEQIEKAKSYKSLTTRTTSDGIQLVECSYLGKITNQEQIAELWENLFADDVNMIVYQDDKFAKYDIVPLKRLKEKMKDSEINTSIDFLKQQLDSVIQIGTELLDLKWLYKGNLLHSTAIVYNGKIVYDHIGCMIVLSNEESLMEEEIPMYPVRTRSEVEDNKQRSFRTSNNGGMNIFGDYVWEYNIQCTSFFDSDGVLINYSMFADHDSAIGWSCDATIKTVAGQIRVSDYHTFSYGYAYAYGINVTVKIVDGEISLPFGAHGGGATLTHSVK